MASYSVKLYWNDEIRRFSFPRSTTGPIFSNMVQKIRAMYPNLDLRTVNLCWKDAEGDNVVFSTDEELREAMNTVQGDVIRVYLIGKSKSVEVEHIETDQTEVPPPQVEKEIPQVQKENQQEQTQNVHPHVTCDGCNSAVVGCRYKCLICPDYDLCERCEGEKKHNEHAMIRIASANDKSWRDAWMSQQTQWFGFNPHGHHHHHGFHRYCHQRAAAAAAAAASAANMNVGGAQATAEGNAQAGAGAGQPGERPGERFLRSIGEQIAHVLNGFGIDVDVDVEDRSANNGNATQQAEAEKPQNEKAKATEQQQQMETEAPAPTEAPNKESSQEQVTEGMQNMDIQTTDWQFVDHAAVQNNSSTRLYPQAPPMEPEVVRAPLHPDPRIAGSLEQMMSMGFTNDGGWLTQLLEAKQGDIAAVLDVLAPANRPL